MIKAGNYVEIISFINSFHEDDIDRIPMKTQISKSIFKVKEEYKRDGEYFILFGSKYIWHKDDLKIVIK